MSPLTMSASPISASPTSASPTSASPTSASPTSTASTSATTTNEAISGEAKESQEFALVQLTDKEIIEFTRVQNSQSWKGALSTQDYVLREHVLSKSQMTSQDPNKLLVFMLFKKPLQKGAALCSIELLIREAWIYQKIDGKVEKKQVLSGCIGGVFTLQEHRGNGYARIMVNELKKWAQGEDNVSGGVGKQGFLFLYSEIGEYYAKNGFKSFPVDLIKIPMPAKTSTSLVKEDADGLDFELIKYHDFEHLMNLYQQKLDDSLWQKTQLDGKTRVCIKPTSDIIDWFHLRSKFITFKLFPLPQWSKSIDFQNESYDSIKAKLEHSSPTHFGIKLINKETHEIFGFVIWTIDWNEANPKTTKATVLKLVCFKNENKVDVVKKIISYMVDYLSKSQIEGCSTTEVVIWESELQEYGSNELKEWLKSELKASINLENPSRSAILMNDYQEDEKLKSGGIVWEENTKLSWF